MRLFLSAVDHGSIARAAAANAIAASAVSRRISELESCLGTALLFRKTKGVAPTTAGETLVRHAHDVLRLLDRMEAEMSEYADGARGHVRIVANSSAIIQFLPDDLSRFKAAYPDVRVTLSEQTSDVAVQEVSKGLADIAIFSTAVSSGGLEVLPYRQDRLVVISPHEHPLANRNDVSFEEALAYEHVGLQPGSSLLGQLEAHAAQLERAISFAVQVTSFEGVRRMVESGLGIAVLPQGAIMPGADERGLNVAALSDDWAKRSLRVGVREAQALSVVARKMLANLTSAQIPAPANESLVQ